MAPLRRAGVAAAVVVLLAVVALAVGFPIPIGDAMLLQPPPRPPLAAWHRSDTRQFTVRAADGTILRGWILPGRPDAPWLVMEYGNSGSIVSMLGLARWFQRRIGTTTVLWDYRGYGFSGGKIDALANRSDAVRVYDRIRERAGNTPFLYGLSLGSAVAVHVAASRPVRALVLHAPPASADAELRWMRGRLPWPLRRLRPLPSTSVRIALDEAREIKLIRTPLLVLHGDADTLVPIAQGLAVERAAGSRDKHFISIHGAEHNIVLYGGTPAGDAIAAFLRAR